MTLIQSLILGIIQGLTEFLPISSSAHLVLVPHLLGWQIPEAQVFPFDVLVQLGTLAAVILYFWKDLWSIIREFFKALVARNPFGTQDARLGWYLILATIPAGIAGILIKDTVESFFNSATATAVFLFGTAVLLTLAELLGKRKRDFADIKWLDALVIGLFQMISLFPGISRSGSTIAGGMFRKLDRPAAARFSFLMSIPVMLGAGLVSFKDALEMPDFSSFLPIILVGFLAALLVGYLSIHWLLNFLGKRSLYVFAVYCILLGTLVLTLGWVKKDAQAQNIGVQTATDITPSAAELVTTNPTVDDLLMVAYTPSLSWLLPAMNVCTNSIPGLNVVVSESPSGVLQPETEDVLLRWGALANDSHNTFVLGTDDLAIVVNSSNPFTSASVPLINAIYSGDIATWGDVYSQCPDCFTTSPDEAFQAQTIATYSYSNNEETQTQFLKVFMNGLDKISSPGQLVPDGLSMSSEIENDIAAIGFIPSHFITDGVKRLTITGVDFTDELALPILAITNTDPAPPTAQWLTCIQNILMPKR